MTEVTPHPLKTQGFHHFLILLFYDHPAKGRQAFYREVLGLFVFSLRKKCVSPRYRTRTRITCGTAFSFSTICAVVAAFMPLTSSMV